MHYEPEIQMHQSTNFLKEWLNNPNRGKKFNKVYKEKSVVTIIKKKDIIGYDPDDVYQFNPKKIKLLSSTSAYSSSELNFYPKSKETVANNQNLAKTFKPLNQKIEETQNILYQAQMKSNTS